MLEELLGKDLRIHHVGIVARDENQIEDFRNILGLTEIAREKIDKYNVTNVFLTCAGETKLHFMIPHKGTLKNFNQGRGGIHHIAFCTRDIQKTQKILEERGIKFIAPQEQKGIIRFKFNFALPSISGINIEIIEDPDFKWD